MHMASGSRDHANPQGAGVSESPGRLREARWAVAAFASGSGFQSNGHPCFRGWQATLSYMVIANDNNSYAQPFFKVGIVITILQARTRRVGRGLVQGHGADTCRPGCIPLRHPTPGFLISRKLE